MASDIAFAGSEKIASADAKNCLAKAAEFRYS
jgi:hypothetical protein